jgi:uncharacterized protein YegL
MKTHVAIVLDRSGSMAATKDKTIIGYNEQVQQLKMNAKEQDILVSLVTFNGDVVEHLWNVPADQLQEASSEDYTPEGATAMRDAVGYTVKKLLDTTNPNEDNVAYLVIIISDGETNKDIHYSVASLKEMIESCQKTGKWTFTYMGCSENYLKEVSHQTGVPLSNMAVWSNSTGDQALKAMKMSTARSAGYFACRSQGMTSVNNYMNDEVGAVADFTKDNPDSIVANSVDNYMNTNDNPNDTIPVDNSVAPDKIMLGLKAKLRATANVDCKSKQTGVFATGISVDWSQFQCGSNQ